VRDKERKDGGKKEWKGKEGEKGRWKIEPSLQNPV